MKNNFNSLRFVSALLLLAACSVLYVSCSKNKTLTCLNGGTYSSGTCTCPAGYEGTHCEKVTSCNYTGTWVVDEKGSTSPAAQYSISIAPGNNANTFIINNFNNQFSNVAAYTVADSIYIPAQTVNGNTVSGNGYTHAGNNYPGQINMTYKVVNQLTGIENDYGDGNFSDHNSSLWYK